ncbi:phosphoribosylglycinamide formyltransferase [Candidatus Desantisbacteria bacterium CG_4_9_14_3_um_filter_40_11]|uniref:Phosphoribosylglycinamide formyltransferase n=2 Tax=unclassified Candidatus Desantisiibacteriota TaxID=3106372 RepID=A0A2M7P2S4_9BACT|nr:MAG: phosphoribosylglycinamide formyltransferase [Candidatus Desantisbacteria bacterium CG_4_10_14_3_um_filter_40_18]PJB29643.1 MAG: phosphoribosylglycinamide formyltransferase [Candidatus Desantisbacteria bacterium CG_4_9_14_3_um_filter_40_11]
MATVSLGVLVSGRGSNLQAIIDAINGGKLNAAIRIVISNKKDAYALERAKKAGIKTIFIDPKDFLSWQDYEQQMVSQLKANGVELVILAGFMRILTPYFVNAYKDRILNIHPALLPSFPGLHAQQQALEYGVKVTGITVHVVDEGMDTGRIILQRVVDVLSNDTVKSLSERMLRIEHQVYPEAIALYCK